MLYRCTRDAAGKQLWVHVASADLEQFVRSVGGPYAQLLQQLHHQPAESFEGSRQSDLWVDLYEKILVGVHVKTLNKNACHDASSCKSMLSAFLRQHQWIERLTKFTQDSEMQLLQHRTALCHVQMLSANVQTLHVSLVISWLVQLRKIARPWTAGHATCASKSTV